ncbi:MAG: hypothetical protein GXP14_09045 [Gammaproteobacteria bacterium]|nr:hypothetical protein [Gammaproteobacteria bacterium]
MVDKRVIYLNNLDLVIYDWDNGILTRRTTLTDSESDKKLFADLLKKKPDIKTYILVDVVEEEFQNNTLPHVFIKDRQVFINRQLEKSFRNTRYRYADFRGRETSGRQGDLVFFSALTNPEVIDGWLAILLQYKVSMAGIYSFSLVSSRLLKDLTHDRDDVLLITQQKELLRLSFFTKNKLKLSRVTRFVGASEAENAQLIMDEAGKTQRYLTRLRLLSGEGKLSINVVASESIINGLRLQPTNEHWEFRGMSIAEMAVAAHVEQAASDHLSEWLIAQFLCKESFENHYAMACQRRYLVMRNILIPSKLISIIGCVIAVIWSTMYFFDAIDIQKKLHESQQQIQHYTSRYEALEAELPPSPVTADEMKAGVNTAEKLMSNVTSPVPLVIVISEILLMHKQLWIDAIEWKIEQRLLTMLDAPAEIESVNPIDPTELPDEVDGSRIEKQVQVARIEGKIKPFDGNLRQATEQVRAFLTALAKQSMVKDVIEIALPFNEKSTERAAGSLGLDNRASYGASFVVEVIADEHVKYE